MHDIPQDVGFRGLLKNVAEVNAGMRDIKTKGGKVAALKDNIRIQWKGLVWMEC